VLCLVWVKGQLIGNSCMGLKGIRGPWRWVVSLWLLLVVALTASAFPLSPAA